jgi:hypothetical protein
MPEKVKCSGRGCQAPDVRSTMGIPDSLKRDVIDARSSLEVARVDRVNASATAVPYIATNR